jgi:hypothetical protein
MPALQVFNRLAIEKNKELTYFFVGLLHPSESYCTDAEDTTGCGETVHTLLKRLFNVLNTRTMDVGTLNKIAGELNTSVQNNAFAILYNCRFQNETPCGETVFVPIDRSRYLTAVCMIVYLFCKVFGTKTKEEIDELINPHKQIRVHSHYTKMPRISMSNAHVYLVYNILHSYTTVQSNNWLVVALQAAATPNNTFALGTLLKNINRYLALCPYYCDHEDGRDKFLVSVMKLLLALHPDLTICDLSTYQYNADVSLYVFGPTLPVVTKPAIALYMARALNMVTDEEKAPAWNGIVSQLKTKRYRPLANVTTGPRIPEARLQFLQAFAKLYEKPPSKLFGKIILS